jgi:thiamine biosynthesis lipoprotein
MIRTLVPLAFDGSEPALGSRVQVLGGASMGTTWSVRWAGPADAALPPVRAAIEQELDDVIAQMSTWREDSTVSHYNRAEAGSWHTLPPSMAEVLDAGLQMARLSGGAFNPAAGALVEAWGFGPSPRYTDPGFVPPSGAALGAAHARSDWRRLDWQAAERRLLQPGGLRLDFSAIAKGHAVDRVALRLRALGLEHVLVEVGGELRGHGLRPDVQPWWVELEQPPHGADAAASSAQDVPSPPPVTRIALHGLSVATSGDYRRFFAHGSQHLPHTIDPRSGWPIAHGLASVSVVHASCMWADAWSTALTVLGLEAGVALAREHGIAALFLQRGADGRLHETLTPALEALAA